MTCCVDYFRSHFIDTVRNKSSTSPEYRMVGLIPGAGSPGNAGGGLLGVALPKPLRVRTFSRFEKSPNGGGGGGGGSGGPSQLQLHLNKERKYLVSTHSVIIDRPASTSAAPPPLAPSLVATSIHSGNGSPKLVTTTTTSSVQAKNPTLSSMLSPSSSPALLSKPLPSSLMSGLANDSFLFLFAFCRKKIINDQRSLVPPSSSIFLVSDP